VNHELQIPQEQLPEVFAMVIADLLAKITSYKPSLELCLPFAQKIIDEAVASGEGLSFNLNFGPPKQA
jgi:hypothetical protein